ncbi:MAG: hypothetical protein ACOC36_06280 [Fibrobacterota bacterium]
MNRFVLPAAVFFLSALSASSQPIKLSAFLSTARKDVNFRTQTEKIDFLKNSTPDLPFIDEIEFRVEDAVPFSKHLEMHERLRYSVRIEPSGVREAFAARKVHRTALEYNVHKRDMMLNRVLGERYLLAFKLLYTRAVMARTQELITLYEDITHIHNRTTNSIDFDFNSLIKSEDKLTDLKMSLVEQKHLVFSLEERVKSIYPGIRSVDFDTTGLLDINLVNEALSSAPIVIDSSNVYLRERLLKLREAEAEYNHETVSGPRYIKFLELAFDSDQLIDEKERKKDRKDYDLSRAYSIELGFTIPALNTDKLDLNERRIDILDETEEFNELKAELIEEVTTLNGEIRTLVEQYNLLMERRNSIRKESSLNKYMRIEGEDPLVLLRLKERVIKSEIQMEEIRFDIYRKFIRKMDLSGELSRQPLRNVVFKDKELLE